MKIRMKVHMSGTRGNQDWPPLGHVLDVDDDEGAHLCAAGIATPVVDDAVEKAVPPAAEQRTAPDDDLDVLRGRAEFLGVKVDKRWGADRLREEIAKASEEK